MLELSKNLNLQKGARTVSVRKSGDIHMRDPFIFTDKERGLYFLYGTTIEICDGAADIDPYFEVYVSDDLINFEGPYVAFSPEKGFWGVKHYWAPEVFEYHGSYYMFATFKGGIGQDRGTAILKSSRPEGPYKEHSKGHVTLKGHECLDGTFYVDECGKPFIIFCHEWTEMYYGTIKALPLSDDLTCTLSQDPITIIDTKNDQIPWIRHMEDPRVEKKGYLTDAPFIHKNADGGLELLWSSYSVKNYKGCGSGGYVTAVCENESGNISGTWKHREELLLDENTGHAALFYDLNNNLRLVSHANDTLHGYEYPVIFYVDARKNLKIDRKRDDKNV